MNACKIDKIVFWKCKMHFFFTFLEGNALKKINLFLLFPIKILEEEKFIREKYTNPCFFIIHKPLLFHNTQTSQNFKYNILHSVYFVVKCFQM